MIKISRWTFRTKRAAEQYIRAILGRYGQRQPLAGEDLEFVQALLAVHPNRAIIEDCGVARIEVEHFDARTGARRFLVVRSDASIRDFTWQHALYPRNAKTLVMRVCRTAIEDQIREFRDLQFATSRVRTCPMRGIPITAKSAHVDHQPPNTFEKLVATWLKANRLDYSDIDLTVSRDYGTATRFTDEFLQENWREFHRENAVLRALSIAANLSDSKKGNAA